MLWSCYAKLCVYLNSLGLKLLYNYKMETGLQLNYKQSCKANKIKNINIVFMMFFWYLIIAHSMIIVLPTPEQALLNFPWLWETLFSKDILFFKPTKKPSFPSMPGQKQLCRCEGET